MRYLIFLCVFSIFNVFLNAQKLNDDYVRHITVNVFSDKDVRYIDNIKSELSDRIVKFQFEIKSFPDIDIVINVAPDKATYSSWVRGKEKVFENSSAFTNLKTYEIFIKNPTQFSDSRKFINVLLHEYIHIFIDYHFKDAPLWFHEGMANYFSEKQTLNQTFNYVRNNAFNKNYLLIKYAYRYPEQKANIEPYYFQATLIIKRTYEDKMKNFINLFYYAEEHSRFSDAFLAAFGKSQEEFLRNFEKEMNNFFKTHFYIGIMLLTWSLFPIFLIIAKIKQNRRTKRLLQKWEIEEQLAVTNSE